MRIIGLKHKTFTIGKVPSCDKAPFEREVGLHLHLENLLYLHIQGQYNAY